MTFFNLLFLGGLALSGTLAAPHRSGSGYIDRGRLRESRAISNGTCPAPVTEYTKAQKPSPFSPLGSDEVSSLVAWLQDPARGLNLTDADSPDLAMSDNYLYFMEELKPNKTDVLAYLDQGVPMPRYARVIINEGGKEVPVVAEYFVGPLPISTETTIQPLDYMYNGVNGGKVLYNAKFHDGPRQAAIEAVIAKTMTGIADITLDLLGLAYYGEKDERSTLTFFITAPFSRNGTEGSGWSLFRRAGLGDYLQPTDLTMRWDIRGTDGSLFNLEMIVFNNQLFHSVEEFRAAWESGSIKKRPRLTSDLSYVHKDRKGPAREMENRMAPTVIEPEGKRYKVDTENKYVEYLGWKFYTRFDRDIGIQFYDIKFKEERIMYELSMQDAIAQYSGMDPFQSQTAYMDRYWGIGSQVNRLVPGYDCPYHATYWNTAFNKGLEAITANNTICIFETDMGTPITRHFEPTRGKTANGYKQATKGSKLVVRQVATVGNYDYLWDYSFYVDGTITVDAHASGYVQATYYRPEDGGHWGPRIEESISGTLHTHVMNFKADFDLIDTANSLLKTDIIVENVTRPWFPEEGQFEMMRYNFTMVESESQGLLPSINNGQTMYTIQNNDHLNKWGNPRGYRIVPGLSNVGLTSMTNPFFLKSAQFAKQAFAVSRHHDTEPQASAAMNQNVPSAPGVEFWKFFEDDEDMIQQDIVAWVNLGMQHYTRAEDIPNTVMSEAHSSVMFAPQNWGDTELTVDLQNAVIYNDSPDLDGLVQPEMNGVTPPSCLAMGSQDSLLGVFEGLPS